MNQIVSGPTDSNKPIFFKFTINQEEIPTLFTGFQYVQGTRITLSKALIGDATKVDLKVVAIQEGRIPSEVAYQTYEMKEGLHPIPVEEDKGIKRADINE